MASCSYLMFMHIKISDLRRLIREAINDEDAERLVGKYLWPSERGLNVKEPNTPYEDELLWSLAKSIAHNDRPMTPQQVSDIFDLAASGKYADALKFKKSGAVYRGVNVTNEWFQGSFGVTSYEVARSKPLEGLLKKPSSYTKIYEVPDATGLVVGKEGVSGSWTTDFDASLEFTSGVVKSGMPKAALAVVLVSNAANGLFLDYKPFYTMNINRPGGRGMLKKMAKEKEVVSFGPVVITGAYLIRMGQYSDKGTKTKMVNDPTRGYSSKELPVEDLEAEEDAEFITRHGAKYSPLTRV